MPIHSVTHAGRPSAPGGKQLKPLPRWLKVVRGALDACSVRALRMVSHSRNRLTEEEVAGQVERLSYNPAKARKHVEFFGRHVDFEGKSVLDVGCGYGDVAIGLAKAGASRVVGVDLDPLRIECARRNAEAEGVSHVTHFVRADFVEDYVAREGFDYVLSIASFEHVLEVQRCLIKIFETLAPGGKLLTRFGPLWLSPYGAHMFDFTSLPWVHVLFPERVVLRVRRECFRPGQAVSRYEDIVGHLNRITAAKFRAYAQAAGFEISAWRLNPEKDQKWGGILKPFNSLLNWTPGLRELGALTLLAVLEKPRHGGRSRLGASSS